ncbi:hypothetical protein CRUP_038356 [Coryphaenoides rupestris]|nr:hypothetical protein CRUP_038356 [Coryphaenoides rupestris]
MCREAFALDVHFRVAPAEVQSTRKPPVVRTIHRGVMDRVTPVNYCLGALGILLLQGLLCVEGRSILNTGVMLGILVLLLWPHSAHSCPVGCLCHPNGAVSCTGLNLMDVPKPMPSLTYLLQLNDTNINVLNTQSLRNLTLVLRFSLTYSPLDTIHPLAFHVAPQLKSVQLSNNKLSTLPAKVFSPLASLEQLYLGANQLETISVETLAGLTQLLKLDLNRNRIWRLDAGVFDQLSNLTFLNLGGNSIRELPPTIFHSLSRLRQLMLYTNQLETLDADLFSHLPELADLRIHSNRITRLAPKVFWSLGNLQKLSLSNNQLQGVPEKSFYHMPKLSKLTLYKNPLLSLPVLVMGHTPLIQEFYLYSTNLTTVPGNLFSNMTGLLQLNLCLNFQLRELPPELFHDLPKLVKLSIERNDIRVLHPEQFSSLKRVSTIALTPAGFLMTSHILLVTTGVLLIVAAMCGMYRLDKVMRELKVESKDGRHAL